MRGKGVGKELIAQLMQHLKEKFKIQILHLEVYEGNPAKYLYARAGFKEFGCQTRFIKEDGKYIGKIFMQKYL
jgi:putative acetyltransferase